MEVPGPALQGVRLLRITCLLFGLDTRLDQSAGEVKRTLSKRTLCKIGLSIYSTVLMVASCVTLVGHALGARLLMRQADSIPSESVFSWTTLVTHFFLTAYVYVGAYFRKGKLRRLFAEFEANVAIICTEEQRDKCDKALRFVAIGYCCVACVMTYAFFATNDPGRKTDIPSVVVLALARNSSVALKTFQLSRYATSVVATPFVAFFEVLFATMCFTIAHLYASAVMQIKEEEDLPISQSSLRQKLTNHKMLSQFIEHFDDFFADYMIVTIAVTIIDSIVQMRAYFGPGVSLAGVCYTAMRFGAIFVKSFAASKVNQRMDLSLNTKASSLPIANDDEPLPFTQEHRHYLMYLTECSITQAAVSYGGFSAIRNDVIVTIAGTLATYYILLMDTFSSDKGETQQISNDTISQLTATTVDAI